MTTENTKFDALLVEMHKSLRARFDASDALSDEFATVENFIAFEMAQDPQLMRDYQAKFEAQAIEPTIRAAERRGTLLTIGAETPEQVARRTKEAAARAATRGHRMSR